ncbi:neutral zinc metallopeptidase [Lentzea flava]|uniref:Aminopeptidase n=1 Tax=Lentzea flava TaxID=103732 RepID=A0ABQ2V8G1_9PSEU|nr:neutral zinc metallopeptidase [Lentzea flava]MCP2203769.1 putative metalloprotease [Lentzea flava]GGU71175.1 aminopeptidase [Lentzea flava]
MGIGRIAVALAATAALTACASVVEGSPKGERPDPTKVAGLEISNGPSGPKRGVPDADLSVENGDGGEMDQLAINTLADVQEFWKAEIPNSFPGKTFEPVKRFISYDSAGKGVEVCKLNTAGIANAFYCALDDSITWDRGELLPMLKDAFGPMAVVTVLAHEMGHAVQYKLGAASNIGANTPSIVKEQQADCYTGVFMRWIAENKSKHFELSTGEGLNQVLQTMFFIRDAAGTSFEKQGAHGSAFDRVSAFQFGFTRGASRCAEMNEAEINKRITERPFDLADSDQGQGRGNAKIDQDKYLKALDESLRDAYKSSGAAFPTVDKTGIKPCTDAQTTSPASFCPSTNQIQLDLPSLVKIGTPPKKGTKGGIGDFAAFAVIASRFSLSIQHATGFKLDDDAAGQRTACLTGAWAGLTNRPDAAAGLKLSPGDLDEAVAELLADNSLIASDVNGKAVPSGFARVEAFGDGFFRGSSYCVKKYSI